MLVYVSRLLGSAERAVVLAHELGHFHLHDDPVLEDALEHPAQAVAGRRLSGYSPREAKERQADAFAAEFLCPSQRIRREVIEEATRVSAAAAEYGVPLRLALRQATAALLRPPLGTATSPGPTNEPALEPDQLRGVACGARAVLVSGGGGTGKTTMFRARLRHLAAASASPARVLALLGSDHAAETLRDALVGTLPGVAGEAWIGTPRGLGVEIVSRWPDAIPRAADFRILDASGARRLLASCMARVSVARGLPPPSERDVAATARAIALAKAAAGEAGRVAIDPAIAEAYADALREENAIDAGDVLPTAARILETLPDALAAMRQRFEHIIVDDAQDLTPAAARLIDLIGAETGTLWAARDAGSATQRFLGAEPRAIADLVSGRCGTEIVLRRHLRSRGAAFDAVIRFRGWLARPHARRKPFEGARIPLSVSLDEDGEARAVAAQVETLRRAGVRYRDQAVLGRSHAAIDRIAAHLDAAGIPILHLGDVRERADVKALLGLLRIAVDGVAGGLRDAVAIPRYRMSAADADAVVRWSGGPEGSLRPALADPAEVEGVAAEARAALAQMAVDLAGFGPGSTPFEVLATWSFERTDACADRADPSSDLKARLSLVAVHHVLKACEEQEDAGSATPQSVAERIDRIGALDQDTHFRKVSLSAAGQDAVSVMTIHAARGREFQAVHLTGCTAPRHAGGDDEAEALAFLAALSRARRHLHLSRPQTRGGRSVRPSRCLDGLADVLEERRA